MSDATTTLPGEPAIEGTMSLYKQVRPVSPAAYRDKSIQLGGESFAFAARTPLIPITVDEFERAALDYPIVFVGPDRRAFAVMGLTADRNLFVKPNGTFATGCYIPAYLRRYPFVFARDDANDLRILCLDDTADRVVDSASNPDAAPLFADDQPTDLTRRALNFCQEFEAAEKRTERLATLLDELGLFETRQAMFNPVGDDASPQLLIEFAGVNRIALDALSVEQFGRLREAGVLGVIFAQQVSHANWEVLSLRTSRADAI